ncbi:hypothetical protein Micbo1qcDRAFT_218869 [Microdochium bolleyi]|uniref:Uncharacterized protein n=1 Tax=Microdochium bolleyi TaxID=196109 RepID=A0A136IP94_9PEZI|nr:hypothetical protein Micbo1qcDRAFT_218869 [Microdochium bolleyi]
MAAEGEGQSVQARHEAQGDAAVATASDSDRVVRGRGVQPAGAGLLRTNCLDGAPLRLPGVPVMGAPPTTNSPEETFRTRFSSPCHAGMEARPLRQKPCSASQCSTRARERIRRTTTTKPGSLPNSNLNTTMLHTPRPARLRHGLSASCAWRAASDRLVTVSRDKTASMTSRQLSRGQSQGPTISLQETSVQDGAMRVRWRQVANKTSDDQLHRNLSASDSGRHEAQGTRPFASLEAHSAQGLASWVQSGAVVLVQSSPLCHRVMQA